MANYNSISLYRMARIFTYKTVFRSVFVFICLSLFGIVAGHSQNSSVPLKPIDEQKVTEIIPLLTDKPAGFGQPSSQREVWDRLLRSGAYDNFLKNMEDFVFPAFSEGDYF